MTFTALFSCLKISPPFNNVSDYLSYPLMIYKVKPPKCHFRKWCLKRRALIISDSRDYRLAIKEPRRQKSLSSCRKKETFPLLTLNTYCNKGCVYLHLIHWHGRSARGPRCKYEALCRILTFSLTRWQISLCKRQRRTLTFCGISAYLVRSEVRYELLYVGTSR